ncbi:beta-ketoacyl synthase N-terminal-like domain-containing protein [Streptomyces sp. NPDC048416]|uniref:beta-ketoacyl synthase N-terminal-like domain-containing protein n=1 Tax=Streptomyces sp. NPDC048416 TaxID=3365546 RepID=UPI00371AAE62
MAVTAVGAVTAAGTSVAALFDDMLNERRPFTGRQIPLVANALPHGPGGQDRGHGREVFAAHVRDPLDLTDVVGARAARSFGRDSRLLVYAAHTTGVARAAGAAAERTGVVLGTLYAGRNEYLAIHDAFDGASAGPVNPVWGPQAGYNAPAAQLSIHLDARGPNLTLSCGATAGLDAVVTGVQQVDDGICDTVLAAGLDTLSVADAGEPGAAPGTAGAAHGAGPGAAVPRGEAAAVLVLEGAACDDERVLARILGTGQAAAAPTAAPTGPQPTPELAGAAEEAVRAALGQAGRTPADVGLAVITTADQGEARAAELAALAAVFGPGLPVCCATATTGRAGGADGVIAVAVAVEALTRRIVPPAAGPRPWPVAPTGTLALCLSVDPAGRATAVVVRGPESSQEAAA